MEECDVPELECADAAGRLGRIEKAPVGEQLDGRAFRILKRHLSRHTRQRVAAGLAGDAEAFELPAHLGGTHLCADLERQLRAALRRPPFQHDRQLAVARAEAGAVGLACDQREADDVPIVVDLLVEIGGLERGMPDALGLDHEVLQHGRSFLARGRPTNPVCVRATALAASAYFHLRASSQLAEVDQRMTIADDIHSWQ